MTGHRIRRHPTIEARHCRPGLHAADDVRDVARSRRARGGSSRSRTGSRPRRSSPRAPRRSSSGRRPASSCRGIGDARPRCAPLSTSPGRRTSGATAVRDRASDAASELLDVDLLGGRERAGPTARQASTPPARKPATFSRPTRASRILASRRGSASAATRTIGASGGRSVPAQLANCPDSPMWKAPGNVARRRSRRRPARRGRPLRASSASRDVVRRRARRAAGGRRGYRLPARFISHVAREIRGRLRKVRGHRAHELLAAHRLRARS